MVTPAAEFFQALFPYLSGRYRIEVRSFDGNRNPRQRWFASADDAIAEAEFLSDTHDVYFGAAARRGESGTKEGVGYCAALFADADDWPATEARIEELGFPYPSAIISSGRGKHLYWLLEAPFRVQTPGDILAFEVVNKGIAAALGCDNCSDIPHVYRVPGTLNHKPGGPYPVELEELDASRRYHLEDFAAYRGRPRPPKPGANCNSAPSSPWADFVPIGERNHTQFAEFCDMAEAGLSEAEAEVAMRQRFASHYEQGGPGSERDMRDTLRSAFRYVARRHEATLRAVGFEGLDSQSTSIKSGHLNGDSDSREGKSASESGHLNVGLALVRASDVTPEEVRWRWKHRIPVGKLTIIEGDPGEGKSYLTLAIATAVTWGQPLPGDSGTFEPRDVLIFSAEDGKADTIVPRLIELGADLSRVFIVDGCIDADGEKRWPNLKDDLGYIEATLQQRNFGLAIVDPINAYLGETRANEDVAIRGVLGPLADLAERNKVTVIPLRHLTKGARDRAIYRGAGSIGYTAAARSVLLVGRDADTQQHVILCIKHNLAPESPAVAYEIDEAGCFSWTGEVDITADRILSPDPTSAERGSRDEAIEFLKEALADGPCLAVEVLNQARRLGIADRTLQRARQDLGVKAVPFYEQGKRGSAGWKWQLG
jgi:hypothetical protein